MKLLQGLVFTLMLVITLLLYWFGKYLYAGFLTAYLFSITVYYFSGYSDFLQFQKDHLPFQKKINFRIVKNTAIVLVTLHILFCFFFWIAYRNGADLRGMFSPIYEVFNAYYIRNNYVFMLENSDHFQVVFYPFLVIFLCFFSIFWNFYIVGSVSHGKYILSETGNNSFFMGLPFICLMVVLVFYMVLNFILNGSMSVGGGWPSIRFNSPLSFMVLAQISFNVVYLFFAVCFSFIVSVINFLLKKIHPGI